MREQVDHSRRIMTARNNTDEQVNMMEAFLERIENKALKTFTIVYVDICDEREKRDFIKSTLSVDKSVYQINKSNATICLPYSKDPRGMSYNDAKVLLEEVEQEYEQFDKAQMQALGRKRYFFIASMYWFLENFSN